MTTAAEDKNNYYYVNGQRVPLVREPCVYAVKFAPGEKSDSPNLSRRAGRLLREDSENIYFIPNYGLQVYRATPKVNRTEKEKEATLADFKSAVEELNREAVVQYAAPAFRRTTDSGELMYVTNRFAVQFKPEVTSKQINELNAQHGVTLLEPLGYCENGFLLQAPEGTGTQSAVALANDYYENGLCVFATPDFIRKTHFRQATARPRVYEMARELGISAKSLMNILHDLRVDVKSHMSTVAKEVCEAVRERLSNSGNYGARTAKSTVGAPVYEHVKERGVGVGTQYLDQQWHLTTAKVIDAWSLYGRGSSSINICVMDDGFDVDHTEFSGKVTRQYDFAVQVDNARPKNVDDNHGTACAGVAVARGQGAAGAAPNCSLIAIRTPGYLGTADEAQMFRRAAEWRADVISCSWGPTDGTGATDLLPDSTRAAIRYCLTQGRNGKGIPIFWASGNGNESVSIDGYASNPDVLAVAASTSNETRAWYSDYGPEIWVCAPSSGDNALGERRIFTVDRTGNAGYNTGDTSAGDAAGNYTNSFGGTSSATPLVAGIAGLMLSANPELTHRQVRDILKDTADKIGGASSYDSSGHSNEFGYGRVNALIAVQRAQGIGTSTTTPTTTSGQLSITGPVSHARTAAAPTFQINSGGNTYYAVEVATHANLFDQNGHGNERNSSNFYGSWEDTALMSAQTYTCPTVVWNRLKSASNLYYRIFTSSSPSSWENYQVSTPDSQATLAPFMQITGAGSSTTTPSTTTGPSITGPAELARTAAAPTFQINSGGNTYYAVEVATHANLFDQNGHGNERNSSNFYGSWEDTALMTAQTYTLPTVVWNRLKSASSLFYRIFTSSSASNWQNYQVSTPDSQASSAPSMQLTGLARTVAAKSTTEPGTGKPSIIGPENYERGAVAPSFSVDSEANRYFAVEVATEARLFCSEHQSEERTENNFFGSWQVGVSECNGETVYTLPPDVWQRLSGAERIYYRVITSDMPDGWTSYDCSTADDNYNDAPWINLRGGISSKINLISHDVQLPRYTLDRAADERLWREQH